jgi:predicted protein tyrosine phosphatase
MDIIICRASELVETARREKPAAVLSIEHPGVAPGEKGAAPRLSAEAGLEDIPQLVLTFWDSEQPVANGPDKAQVRQGIDFVMQHIGQGPVVIHCHAGKARSAGMALGVLSRLHPQKEPEALLEMLLKIRPQAAPNIIVVEMADELTGRKGTLVQAVLDHPVIARQRAAAEHNRQEMVKRDPALLKKLHPEKNFKP